MIELKLIKRDVWEGILRAAIRFRNDEDFGEEVRRLLLRGKVIRRKESGGYELQ